MAQKQSMHQIILNQLKKTSQHSFPQKVFYAISGVPLIPNAFIQIWPRLDIILSGEKEISLPLASGVTKLNLKTGDAYYATPHSWECHNWNTVCQMLCIVPRNNWLRVSYYDQQDATDRPSPFFHHTLHPYSKTFKNTSEALNSISEPTNAQYIKHLCRALVDLSIIELTPKKSSSISKAVRTYQQIYAWMEERFQEDIDRDTAAQVFHVSSSYVSQLFKKTSGSGFHYQLSQLRINFAKKLLKTTDLSIHQIADQCGFRNYVHFVRRFRELEGLPPGKYRTKC